MQFPGVPVFPDPAPVPETVSHVAGLLDLIALDPGAQRVDRAAGDIEHVSRFNLHPMKAFFQPAGRHDIVQFFAVGIDSVNQTGAWCRVQDIPGFALAAFSFMVHRISVVRMYLDGQALLRIEDLEHQRKSFLPLSGQPVSPDRKNLPQRSSPVRAVCHPAFVTGQRGNLQAFPGDLLRRLLAVFFSQGMSAPGRALPAPERGFHNQRINFSRFFHIPLHYSFAYHAFTTFSACLPTTENPVSGFVSGSFVYQSHQNMPPNQGSSHTERKQDS